MIFPLSTSCHSVVSSQSTYLRYLAGNFSFCTCLASGGEQSCEKLRERRSRCKVTGISLRTEYVESLVASLVFSFVSLSTMGFVIVRAWFNRTKIVK